MSAGRQDGRAIQDQMIKLELVEGLQRAIDYRYLRLFESAKQEWERRFGGKDPSDACASVRIESFTAATSAKALSRAGYLPKPMRPRNRQMRLRLAYSLGRTAK